MLLASGVRLVGVFYRVPIPPWNRRPIDFPLPCVRLGRNSRPMLPIAQSKLSTAMPGSEMP